MATQQFYKSMQMLQANAKREKDEPFEDYSIFLYRQTAPDFKDRVKYLEQKILYPDREPKIHVGHRRASIDEEFSGRIKNIEDKLRGSAPSEKKPKDLLRAIGKIEKTDWNVKEIEKKIEESKMGRGVRHDKVERVPKWSREQFLARQIKMEKKGHDPKESDSKYADIDNTLKNIDRKIKEGNALGYNKVSAMAEQFSNKNQEAEPKVQKSNIKPAVALPAQGGSELCHFCNKRVYLMERLSAEGKFFHRGCFRCEYCSISLRIGNHTFDREKNGGRFYCAQHFGFSGTIKGRAEKKRITTLNKENIPNAPTNIKTPEKSKLPLEGVVGLDLLDRGQTPERIEFENLAGISDTEEAHSQMDEDEWTDRNFGVSPAEMGSSDDISDMSDSEDDNEVYEEAIDQPLTTEGTLELAKNWTLRYAHPHTTTGQSDTGSNEYEDSSDEYTSEDDENATATEDEDDARARELRKQEVWLKVPPRSSDTDTGSETEVKISQDSIDIVTQEAFVPHDSTSAHVSNDSPSPVSSAVKSEMPTESNSVMQKDLRDTSDSKTLDLATSDASSLARNNIVNSTCKNDTALDEVSRSVIGVFDSSLKILEIIESKVTDKDNTDDTINDKVNDKIKDKDRELVTSNNVPMVDLCEKENKEECNSEYESLVEENIPLDRHEINDHTKVSSSIQLQDANSSDSNPIDIRDDIITLPDAVPSRESENISAWCNANVIDDNLPDLIVSSPKTSRHSSPCSSSDVYRSIETLCNEISERDFFTAPREDEISSSTRQTNTREKMLERFDEKETNMIGKHSISKNEDHRPNLIIKASEEMTCPVVMITSPSPTNEKPLEEGPIEASKLTVPKEVPNQPAPTEGTSTSFEQLKQDLKRRKEKNKLAMAELRPLSTENARRKISTYFTEKKKPTTQKIRAVNKEIDRKEELPEVVKLDIKPKLSNKVDTKDIIKYFGKTESANPANKLEDSKMRRDVDEYSLGTSIDKLNGLDVDDGDALDQKFVQVEKENKNVILVNAKLDSSNLHAKPLHSEPDSAVENIGNDIDIVKEITKSVAPLKDSNTKSEHETDSVLNKTADPSQQKGILLPHEYHLKFDGDSITFSKRNTESSTSARGSNHIYASDGTLNINKEQNSILQAHRKSLSAMSNFSSVATSMEKVIPGKEEIDVSGRNNNTSVTIPKRPERKQTSQESNAVPKDNATIVQISAPEIPARKKSGKRKNNNPIDNTVVNSVNSSQSVKLVLPDSNSRTTTHQSAREDLETVDADKSENTASVSQNVHVERIHQHPTNKHLLNKSHLRESTKSVSSSKSERAKKEKCTVS
ncbi:hypothetical protein KM043_010752 [Ampulex compressa]|nr:hypothetical protein KM043_010752 [Ampulex compressa]